MQIGHCSYARCRSQLTACDERLTHGRIDTIDPAYNHPRNNKFDHEVLMIRVKLTSILVNDQNHARRFYTDLLGFRIKHDIPLGEAAWLTLVAPDDADGVELLLDVGGESRCGS